MSSDHWVVQAADNVCRAQLLSRTHRSLIPNDPLFAFEWGLNNTGQTGGLPGADIDAIEAWDIFTGSPDTVVAVIDTGVDYLHEDLKDNMWHNPGEIPGDGIDNDGNGYIDDVYGIAPGIDATNADPMDYVWAMARTWRARLVRPGNNGIGVTGINWDVQIMAVNILEGSAGRNDRCRGCRHLVCDDDA